MLTLVGPGSIGKTRLAIESAARYAGTTGNPIYFVNLQSVHSTSQLTAAIANALELTPGGSRPLRDQLLNHLRDWTLLLVLDNFEQMLVSQPATSEQTDDATDLLIDILHAAPNVKVIVTSREVLNLQEEAIFSVSGLPFPFDSSADNLADFSAIQLFTERAQRVRRDFSLANERNDVVRLCRLVGGMPLAIELAASWIKTLTCGDIAVEIQRNLDFLTTGLRNVPERHRNMQAVFNQSWALLTEQERTIFKRLSVFLGGFQREAASKVAGASLATLTSLVDKSLVRWDPDGRYQIHELSRQYAQEKLEQTPDEAQRIRTKHCEYYAGLLHKYERIILKDNHLEAMAAIEVDLGNIWQAWHWAVAERNVDAIAGCIYNLLNYNDLKGLHLETIMLFSEAIAHLEKPAMGEQTTTTIAHILSQMGYPYMRLGQWAKSEATFSKANLLYEKTGATPLPVLGGDPLAGLSFCAAAQGKYGRMMELGQELLQRSMKREDKENQVIGLRILTIAYFALGNFETAYARAQEAYALIEQIRLWWYGAGVLTDLGNIACEMGDYRQARIHFKQSYRIARDQIKDRYRIAESLYHLAKLACLEEAYEQAEGLYKESLRIYRDLNFRVHMAYVLRGLGNVILVQGVIGAARQHFREALEIFEDTKHRPGSLEVLTDICVLYTQVGHQHRVLALLHLAFNHPAST